MNTMTFQNDFRLGSENVVSISAACDEQLAREIRKNDYIRAEALRRTCAMPGYTIKPLRWKNRYYDYWQKKVMQEVNSDV